MHKSDIYTIFIVDIVFCVIMLGLSIYLVTQYPEQPLFYKSMVEGWQREPIYSIRKVSITTQCDLDDDEVSGFQFEWPGNDAGCYCQGQDSFTFTIFKSRCSSEQISDGCQQIPQFPSQKIDYWSETGNFSRFCIKRVRNWNFWDNTEDFYKDECPQGKTLCRPDSSDTGGVRFCVPSNFGCPFRQISYGKPINETSDLKLFTTTNESLSALNTKYLVLNKGVSAFPLIDLAISEAGPICLNPKQKNITPRREDYSLLMRKRTGCEDGTDPKYSLLNQIGEIELFSGLPQYSTISSSLIGYNLNNQYKYGYYHKSQTPFTQKCISEGYLDGIRDYDYRTKTLQAFFILNLIMVFAFCVVNFYTLWVERETVQLILYDEEQIRAYFVFSSRRLNRRIYGTTLFAFIFNVVLLIVALRQLSIPYFTYLYNCVDDETVRLFREFYFECMHKYGIQVILLFTVFLIFPLVRLTIQCYSWPPNETTRMILDRARIELDFFSKITFEMPVKQVQLVEKPNQVVQEPQTDQQIVEEKDEEDVLPGQEKSPEIKMPEFNPHNQKEARLLYIESEIFRLQENIRRIKSQKSSQKVISQIQEEIRTLQKEEIKIREEIKQYNENQEKLKLDQSQQQIALQQGLASPNEQIELKISQGENKESQNNLSEHSRNPSEIQLLQNQTKK